MTARKWSLIYEETDDTKRGVAPFGEITKEFKEFLKSWPGCKEGKIVLVLDIKGIPTKSILEWTFYNEFHYRERWYQPVGGGSS